MKQSDWIQEILKLRPSGFDPKVEQHYRDEEGELQYGSWESYNGQEEIDERSVFPNEIVIDVDADTTEKCREETRKVCTLLDSIEHLPYIVADTAGTGFHVHLFFQIPDDKDWTELRPHRLWLYDYLKARAEEEVEADTNLWDDGMVDFDAEMSSGHLVRAVGGRKKSTGHRKTTVLSSTLEKEEVEEPEEVEYPASIDFVRMSKLPEQADLSWSEVQEKAEEIKEKEEQRRKEKLESTYQAEDDGLQAVRDLPAHEVLKAFFDVDAAPGQAVRCVVHDSADKDAKVTDGTEKPEVPEGRYGCFGDTCCKNGEMIHWYNAIDLLVESGMYDFEEAVQQLADEFDVEIDMMDSDSGWVTLEELFEDSDTSTKKARHKTALYLKDKYELVTLKDSKELYRFKETIYRDDGEDFLKRKLSENLGFLLGKRDIEEIIERVKNLTQQPRPSFSKYRNIIPVENGHYNLETGELEEPDSDRFVTAKIPVKYDPEADCPEIKEFVSDLVPEDQVPVLQEVIGYTLYTDYPIKKAFMLKGSGNNGKTQFTNLIEKFIGEENVASASLHDLSGGNESRKAKAELYGKLANTNADLSDKKLYQSGAFKELTGRDTTRARKMYQEAFTFKNHAKLIYGANELPETEDTTKAFFRRWILIDFPYEFVDEPTKEHQKPKEDDIVKKIVDEEELSGLFNWAVEGLNRLLDQGKFSTSASMEETKEEWLIRTKPLHVFADKFVEVDHDSYVTKDEFYQAYKDFCQDNNVESITKQKVGKQLETIIQPASATQKRVDGKKVRVWDNISLQESRGEEESGTASTGNEENVTHDAGADTHTDTRVEKSQEGRDTVPIERFSDGKPKDELGSRLWELVDQSGVGGTFVKSILEDEGFNEVEIRERVNQADFIEGSIDDTLSRKRVEVEA